MFYIVTQLYLNLYLIVDHYLYFIFIQHFQSALPLKVIDTSTLSQSHPFIDGGSDYPTEYYPLISSDHLNTCTQTQKCVYLWPGAQFNMRQAIIDWQYLK